MKKILRTKDKLLMAVSLLGDIATEVYVRGSGYRRGSFLNSVLNASPHSFRTALSRSLKTGEINKVIGKDNKVYFRLAPAGKSKLVRRYPLSQLRDKRWDGRWRIVIFDIPEKKRDYRERLRNDLIALGFGKLQESIYITPLDILVDLKEMLKSKGYGQWVMVFEAEQKLTDQAYRMACLVWPIEQLNMEYKEILDEINWQNNNPPTELEKKELKDKFYSLVVRDPFLPRELLPANWKGDLVQKLMLHYG